VDKPARQRRLSLLGPDLVPIKGAVTILDGIPNADALFPLILSITERCDLGHWHQIQALTPMIWGSD
jgi:hypothetical protein